MCMRHRERVEGRDGHPLLPQGGGRFCALTADAQYRIDVHGTRKVVVVGVAAFGNALKLTEDDSAAAEDKASCSCLSGRHVQRAGPLERRRTSPDLAEPCRRGLPQRRTTGCGRPSTPQGCHPREILHFSLGSLPGAGMLRAYG